MSEIHISKTEMEQKITIDLNPQIVKALELMDSSDRNLFITGKAGTGKSTLLNYFRQTTKKKVVVLAPTGVAALNVKGQTVHSFFRFRPDITLDKVKRLPKKRRENSIYKKIDAIIIDEISMVRADLLDCVEKYMRLNGKNNLLPFGGVQMIFIGDLYQIPPVVTSQEKEIFTTLYRSPYFFDAFCFPKTAMEFIELEKVYRQQDPQFIALLNKIRNSSVAEQDLQLLNQRLDTTFNPSLDDYFVHLTPTNNQADEMNESRLGRLKGELFTSHGKTDGEFNLKTLPAKMELQVKPGAQVMMLNNDGLGRWVNGSVGKIIRIEKNDEEDGMPDIIFVKLDNDKTVDVTPFSWELYRFDFNKQTSSLFSETVGTFTQYPLMLAWAVTIHKSQGKTFDKVILDIGRGTFVSGQVYVALSRCTSLGGIILKKIIEKKHIFMDGRITRFLTQFQYKISDRALSLEKKIELIKEAISGKKTLDITYLKSIDEKSQRKVDPVFVGEDEYMGKRYIALRGFDSLSGAERTFSVGKILSIEVCG